MIALISDIHGNYTALKAVLDKIDNMSIEKVFCLGDVVGYYTQINECCNELRDRNVSTVMGNHDWYMVAGSFCPRSNSVNDILRYQKQILSEENHAWLSSLPIYLKEAGVFMLHGGWSDPIDEYVNPSDEYFLKVEGKYFASGHTHIQVIKRTEKKTYCNPGSVGQPRDNDPRAAFATFDGNNFYLHRVEYDTKEVGMLMERAGFSGYYYDCLYSGKKTLGWGKGEPRE